MIQNLKFQALAIGSLPHKNLKDAMAVVEKCEIPFFPQLANISKNEDMVTQFLEGMPSFFPDTPESFSLNLENEQFLKDLEVFFEDFEIKNLDKFAITQKCSCAFPEFEKIIQNKKPNFAKGQIVGPFTLLTSLNTPNGTAAIYDETLRDIVVKLLTLKALWQIERIKKANISTVPIIFMDEPTISQLGTSAYLTITEEEVISMLKEISDSIIENGGISAIHCCGKCDWRIPIKSGVNIINFDAYSFSKNFSIYHKEIKEFLNKGGQIAWGIVPTLNEKLPENLSIEELLQKFKKSVNDLTKKGIDEKLILDNSLITTSCGAGTLSIKGAEKAMNLLYELSKTLREKF